MRFNRRQLLLGGATSILLPANSTSRAASDAPSVHFRHLPIGGGGRVINIDISPDGKTKVCGTDEAGAFLWDFEADAWRQLITQASMPRANFGIFPPGSRNASAFDSLVSPGWIYGIVSAPSRPTTIYMKYSGAVFKSVDRGKTWLQTNYGVLRTAAASKAGDKRIFFHSIPQWVVPRQRFTNLTNNASLDLEYTASHEVGSIDRSSGTNSIGLTAGALTGNIGAGESISFIVNDVASEFDHRWRGPKIAVDPNNPDIVFVGSGATGLQVTKDGGITWSLVTSIPTAKNGYAIAFDPSAAAVGGATSKIYVFSLGNGSGMFASADAGATWRETPGDPKGAVGMTVARSDGAVWACGTDGHVWKFASGGWTKILTDASAHGDSYIAACIDPAFADGSRMAVITKYGKLNRSIDGGRTWGGMISFSRAPANVPWLSATAEQYMLLAAAAYDPNEEHQIICADGIGTWKTPGPTSSNKAATTLWTENSAGIENMVAYHVICPLADSPVVGLYDRFSFKLDATSERYASTSNMNPFSQGQVLGEGYALDFATTDPHFVAGVFLSKNHIPYNFDLSGYSSDAGATFTPFNKWAKTIPATSLSRGSSNGLGGHVIKVDLSSVGGAAGLAGWSSGPHGTQGDIVSIFSYSGTGLSLPYSSKTISFPARIVDNNTIELVGSAFSDSYRTAGKDYLLWVSTNLLSDYNGLQKVTGTGPGKNGTIRVYLSYLSSLSPWGIIEISGTRGAADINGRWVILDTDWKTYVDLLGSRWAGNGWTDGGTVSSRAPVNGSIAASTPDVMIRIPGGDDFPYYTKDRGRTWEKIAAPAQTTTLAVNAPSSSGMEVLFFESVPPWVIPGMAVHGPNGKLSINATVKSRDARTVTLARPLPLALNPGDAVTFLTGWPAYYSYFSATWFNTVCVAADRAVPDVFYMFNYYQGFYQVVKGAIVGSSTINAGRPPYPLNRNSFNFYASGNNVLKTVPGQSGHFFFAAARKGYSVGSRLFRSVDGGRHLYIVPGFYSVSAIGFGAAKPGNKYPSIYVAGFYSPNDNQERAAYGIWRSDDDANAGIGGFADQSNPAVSKSNSWDNIGSYPCGEYFQLFDITGDPKTWGTVYVASNASAYIGELK